MIFYVVSFHDISLLEMISRGDIINLLQSTYIPVYYMYIVNAADIFLHMCCEDNRLIVLIVI